MNEMIPEPETYFSRLVPDRSDLLKRLEAEAGAESIPIIGPVVGELLYILTRISRPQKVLELGTATGYSAIYLAAACREVGGRLVTLEYDPQMARRAQAHLKEAGLSAWATIACTDALEMLAQTTDQYDLVFMDIEKEDYARALPQCRRVLTQGGLLVADNVGFKDADPFNLAIAADPAWRPVNLYALLPGHSPLYDGLCLAVPT
ncbi:MAG: O-methyltransferase [Desulfosarcina sp.]|nr:O-methyltransferase [Desulfobacterales bacterium]